MYFFGNTLLHDLVGGEGPDNWLFWLSRKVRKVGWLVGLVDWLVGWLVGLVDWLVGWFVG